LNEFFKLDDPMKSLIALPLLLLLAWPAFAQDQAARASAGCGPDKVEFGVKTDKRAHPEAQPESGKALVYVFENEKRDSDALPVMNVTTRIGLDGQWVGANHGVSYFSFSADPGEHNLCANWQSSISMYSRLAAAASLTAEAGKVYYFQTTVDQRSHRQPTVRIEPVDPAEAKLLIADSPLSNSRPKK
jgi:hypothetical protein